MHEHVGDDLVGLKILRPPIISAKDTIEVYVLAEKYEIGQQENNIDQEQILDNRRHVSKNVL